MHDPSDQLNQQAARVMVILLTLSAGLATLLHALEPDTHILNRVIPPLLLLGNIMLLVWTFYRPDGYKQVFWLGLTMALVAIGIPIWYFTIQASLGSNLPLVDSLPPITTFPIALIVGIAMFAPHRMALGLGIVGWILIATPLMVYLLSHPQEFWSPRGQEIVVTLGPVMALVTAIVPIHRGLLARLIHLQAEQAFIKLLSERDPLTNLLNRRAAESVLSTSIQETQSQDGLILFDIDHFKRINDNFGHPVGDAVLVEVAQRCRSVLRKEDVLARWGGEEFLVVIRGVELKVLERIAEDLRLAIASERIDPVGQVSASFGISLIRPGDSMESLLQRVDTGMYAAKAGGRNRVKVS